MTGIKDDIILRRLEKFKEEGPKKWHKIYTILAEIINENVQKKRWILLDQLHVEVSSLSKENTQENATKCIQEFVELMFQFYFTHIMCARTNQRVAKVVQVLYYDHNKFLKSTLSKQIDVILDVESNKESVLQKIFILVDSWTLGRSCIEDQLETKWLQLMAGWSSKMLTKVEESQRTNVFNFQDSLLLVIKISLQMFQHFPVKLQMITQEHNPSADQTRQNMKTIVSLIIAVLFSKHLPKECLLLSGTCLSLFLNIETNKSQIIYVISQLLHCAGMESISSAVQAETVRAAISGVDVILPSPSRQPTTLIALLQGFIASSRKDVILHHNLEGRSFLTTVLFATICQLCKTEGSPIVHYLSYEVAKSWMQRVKSLLSDIHQMGNSMLFSTESFHTNNVLDLVWDSMEDPVDGVSTSGRTIFGHLLEAHQEEELIIQDKKTMSDTFYGSLLNKLLAIPWQVKVKYGLICEILPYIEMTEILDKNHGLLQEMAECLKSNQLSSACTEVFKAFLLKSRQGQHDSFQNNWIAVLLKSLTSENRLLAQHTRQYWLPCALKCVPHVLDTLLNQLSGIHNNSCHVNQMLSAKLAIIKVARSLGILDSTQLDEVVLRQALQHQEDTLRLEALGVLCCDVKTSKPIVDVELRLLREFLPHNLYIACPSFRQDLLVAFKKVLCRIRDSSLFSLKKSYPKIFKKPEVQEWDARLLTISSDIQLSLEFVNWVFMLMCNSLLPGANYQRQKTAVDFISLIFETFSVSDNPDKRKGQAPESCRILMKLAEQKRLWDFYSSRTVHILLGCLQSSHSDIRELARDILRKKFPTPFKARDETISDTEFAVELMKEARALICSAKAQECESGSILCELLFESYAVKLRWRFIDIFGDVTVEHLSKNNASNDDGGVKFLIELVGEAERQFKVAKKDLSVAAEECPIHGILLTLCRCIISYLDVTSDSIPEFGSVIQKTVSIVLDVVDYLLGVLSKKQDSKSVVCGASFAGLGEAVSDAISTSCTDADIATSQQHMKEFIMSCCFLTIKFGCHLLSSIVEKTLLTERAPGGSLLSNETLTSIGEMFIKIFTQCRLTGILLSCKLSMMAVCRCLSGSDVDCLFSLPRRWIQNVIDSISGDGAASSVTRRSAGLPVLMANILASEMPSKRSLTAKYCFDELLKIAFQPIPDVIDQTTDLPQVHAMNILRSLYQDTALGNDVLQFTEQGFILAVDGFASPLWSIRNAATQLFGSLVLRTLGHKRGFQDENQVNAISARDFFKRFSSLREFFLKQLQSFSTKHQEKSFLRPELFPVLTLLSKLRPAACDVEENLLADFVPVLTPLSANPVYAVRALAAQALVPFIPVEKVFCKAAEILRSIPLSLRDISQNRIHGTLLQVHRLVDSLANPRVTEQALQIITELCSRSWLGTSNNACAVTRAEYLTLVLDVYSLIGSKGDSLVSLSTCLNADPVEGSGIIVGLPCLQRAVLRVNMDIVKRDSSSEGFIDTKRHVSIMDKSLHSVERETRIAALECLNELSENNHVIILELDESLTSLISMETDQRCLLLALEYFINVKRQSDQITIKDWDLLWEKLLSYTQGSRGSTVQSKAIVVLSILLRCRLRQSSDIQQSVSVATDWCYSISECSLPNKPEPVRNGAALGIGIAGAEYLFWVEKYRDCSSFRSSAMEAVVRIFQTGLMLLEDEQDDVRIEASNFGAKIHNHRDEHFDFKNVTCSVSMESIFKYMSQNFFWSSEVWSVMLVLIRGRHSVPDLLSDYAKSRRILFEQEDCNLYAEPFVTIQLGCKYLKEMIDIAFSEKNETTTSNLRVWSRIMLETEYNKLKSDLHILRNEGSDQDGGSLQNPKLFTLRYRLVVMSDVMKYLSSSLGNPVFFDKEDLSGQIRDVLLQVNKTSVGCHPILYELHTKDDSH